MATIQIGAGASFTLCAACSVGDDAAGDRQPARGADDHGLFGHGGRRHGQLQLHAGHDDRQRSRHRTRRAKASKWWSPTTTVAFDSDSLDITIVDDKPEAQPDTDSFGSAPTGTSITGNVIDGTGTNEQVSNAGDDIFGADGPAVGGGVISFEHSGGSSSDTGTSGLAGATIAGNFGTLLLNADGSYTYTRTSGSAGIDEFTYTIVDGDGDTDTATLTIELDNAAVPTATSPFVMADEDDLDAPPAPFQGNDNGSAGDAAQSGLTGSLGSYGSDGQGAGGVSFAGMTGAVTALGYPTVSSGGEQLFYYWNGATNTLYGTTNTATPADAAANAAFKIEVNQATAGYTFTLLAPLDHKVAGTEDDIDLALNYTITDNNGDSVPGIVSVTVDDDLPIAASDSATTIEGGKETVNLVLVVDRSGSMGDDPDGPGGYATRLDLAKAALVNLIQTGNTANVMLVSFSSSATNSGWLTPAQAIIQINALIADGSTDYDAAADSLYTGYGSEPAADKTFVFFVSDGEPTEGDGTDGIVNNPGDMEIQAWEQFITSKQIDQAFAVGVGNGVNVGNLQPLAYPNGDATNPVVIVNESELFGVLTGALPGSVSGNVATNDDFGADGGHVLSIKIGAVTYTYHADTDTITNDANATVINGSTLNVATQLNGQLVFHLPTRSASMPASSATSRPRTCPLRDRGELRVCAGRRRRRHHGGANAASVDQPEHHSDGRRRDHHTGRARSADHPVRRRCSTATPTPMQARLCWSTAFRRR